MIRITYKEFPDEGVLSLRAEGHAGYATEGQDIVCAAVSALVQTLAFDVADGVSGSSIHCGGDENGNGNEMVVQATRSMMNRAKFELVASGLSLLAEQYPENVSFEQMRSEPLDLQMFASDGTGDGGAAEGTEGAAGGDGTSQALRVSSPNRGAKGREATAAEVDEMLEPTGTDDEGEADGGAEPEKDGKDKTSQSAQSADSSPDRGAKEDDEARRKEFGKLMRGQYSREFGEMVMRATQEAHQQLMGENTPVGRILAALGQKYGTAPGDYEALAAAVEGGVVKDDAYYEDMAMKKGISVKLAREMDALEAENEQHRAAEAQREEAAKVAAIQQEWDAAVERIQTDDPDFDIKAALADPDFARMLKLGMKMEDAYKARYFDDIMARKTAQTAKATEAGVVERIRQRGSRPSENGVAPGGAAVLKTDVSKLTKAQCEELERRARRGQIISF